MACVSLPPAYHSEDNKVNIDELRAEGTTLNAAARAKLAELVAAIKRGENAEAGAPSWRELRGLAAELRAIDAELARVVAQLQETIGVSEEEMLVIERAGLPALEDRWWRHQILTTPPSEDLDSFCQEAVDAMLKRVDPAWLKEEGTHPYRLSDRFLTTPLHVVGGTRLPREGEPAAPQRFAHMLLVAIDHLKKRDDLDFFAAASFVPELAALGRRLDCIPLLAPEAIRKFNRLPLATADEVGATIYELLVGTACVKRGLDTEMLAALNSEKSPDFRLHNLAVPAVIECKRRLGLTHYELAEARIVECLYDRLREKARIGGFHGAVEVRFSVPVEKVDPDDFLSVVMAALNQSADVEGIGADWGE